MTKLEQILKARVWRGATVEEVEHAGAPAYRLTHPSGAVAIVLKEPGDMDSRKWLPWAREQDLERRGYTAAAAKVRRSRTRVR